MIRSALLPLTGFFFLVSSVFVLESSAAYPVSCVTRAADLMEDGMVVLCPADCTRWRVSVYGTGVYAAVSSICGAAIHRGILGLSGGSVKVQKLQGRQNYLSSYSNGIQSQALARWSSSFSLAKPAADPQELTSQTNTTAAKAAKKAVKPVKKPSVKKALTGENKECQMDIAMVIDSSQNIGQRRFNLQKSFVTKLISTLRVGVTGPHVGLIQASDTPHTEFYLMNYTQPKGLQFAIKELPYRGGNTNAGMNTNTGMNTTQVVCKDNGFFHYVIPSWFTSTKHVKPLSQRLCSVDAMLCSKTCFNSVNIGFLIDGSSSVGESNFQQVLNFLSAIVSNFDISDMASRIGAVQFTYDQRLEFGLSDHPSKDGVQNALKRIPYMSGGTATGQAISYTAENLFRRAGPGLNFLILVTDGQSYDDVRGPAIAAHKQGITIFTVGVAWAPMDDLRSMASEPKDSHTFFTREFSDLHEFIQPIVRNLCQDFNKAN
ncbi:hypothetical protein LDENG_00258150 [Lucifuga dentata]|nr:hypothetical protein LDENG_00258150 [Lucifuga dentata]